MNGNSGTDASTRLPLRAARRVAAAATLLTILLAVGKGLVGHLRGSPALTADAVHSAADTLAILASWIGLQLSGRPPTRRFPFGLYRAETLAALLASGFILAAAVRLLVDSGGALLGRPQGLHHSLEVLGVALASAGVSAGIYVAERRAGRRLGSGSLLANADESRADILISLGVFAGAAASYVGVPRVEWAVTAALAGAILWLGLKHGRAALLSLMDASPDPALEAHIATVAARVPGVKAVGELRLRQTGLFWVGIAGIQISRSLDIARGHEVAHAVARAVRQAVPRIESLTVHLEPFVAAELTVMVPVEGEDQDALVSPHFGRAPCFALAALAGGAIGSVEFIGNEARTRSARAGLAAVKEVLTRHRVDVVLTREIGEISYHALRDHYVEVYGAPPEPLGAVLRRFAAGGLDLLPGPTHASEAAGAEMALEEPDG